MPRLSIQLFGYPRIECDGIEVPIRRRKALALVAYLATTGSNQSRDTLAALLWPESEAPRAFAFLRNALWLINRTPLSEWLVTTRHTVGLRTDENVWIDVRAFRQTLHGLLNADSSKSIAEIEEALRGSESDFLSGFSIDESEPFEDWHYSESSALRHEAGTAYERLAETYQERGENDEAIQLLQRWVQREPLNESIHRHLIELLAATGQRALAMRQFETCRQLLNDELSLSPAEETARLVERILEDAPAPPTKAGKSQGRQANLPTYRTPFVGREEEFARAVALLTEEECRLLTITGTGGCGKTRLAVETARHVRNAFPDGVFFVPLASTESSSDVPLEIEDVLAAFATPETVDQSPDATPGLFSDLLLARLKPQRMLLVLDNMEHLLRDLRWLRSLLDAAPSVRILVTSRQQLNLKDEWILPLEGLPFPEGASLPEELRALDSVALFLQAAKRANASFVPSEEDWPAIASIVRRLEGSPLGIELAAASLRMANPQVVASEIEKNMDFLSSRMRDAPKRHQSLRAAFDRSWQLLSKEHREAFRALSVFRGGFTPEAAQIVVQTTLPVISSLVARSLLRPTTADRLEMHEVLRQFAEERLRQSPQGDGEVREAHALRFLSLVSEQEPALKGSNQRQASETLLADLDNIRAAWRWAVENRATEMLDRSAVGLFLFCDMRNHFDEGVQLFRQAAEALGKCEDEPTCRLCGFLRVFEAWFAGMRQGREQAHGIFDRAFRTLEPLRVGKEHAFAGLLSAFAGHSVDEERERRLREALNYFEEVGAAWEQAEVLEALSWGLLKQNQHEAVSCAERSVELHQELGDPWGVAMAQFSLGSLYAAIGSHKMAMANIEESLALRRENDLDRLGAMQCLASLGYLTLQTGDLSASVQHYQDALSLAEQAGATWAQATTHESLVDAMWLLENRDQAAFHASAAASIYRSFGRTEDAERCDRRLETLRAEGSPAQD